MPTSSIPWIVVPCSAAAYAAIARALRDIRALGSGAAQNRAISAGHASFSTILTLYALYAADLDLSAPRGGVRGPGPAYKPDGNLDDSINPFIQQRSALANVITAWETGYLLYDTASMVRLAGARHCSRGFLAAARHAARDNPDILAHHVVLSAAFLTLQVYTARGRERGVLVVLALILMNGSSPVMHARWWARKQGRDTRFLDMAFVVAFALARFSTVAYVLKAYGAYHGIGAWKAFRSLRLQCRTGTTGLMLVNGMWWLALLRGVIMKRLRPRAKP